jgi:hypothetical protein
MPCRYLVVMFVGSLLNFSCRTRSSLHMCSVQGLSVRLKNILKHINLGALQAHMHTCAHTFIPTHMRTFFQTLYEHTNTHHTFIHTYTANEYIPTYLHTCLPTHKHTCTISSPLHKTLPYICTHTHMRKKLSDALQAYVHTHTYIHKQKTHTSINAHSQVQAYFQ